MIDKLTYEEVLEISKKLKEEAAKVDKIAQARNMNEIIDFVATVEGYSKFLENSIEIHKDADKALEGLKNQKK